MKKNNHKKQKTSTINPSPDMKSLMMGGLSTHSNLNQRLVYLYESTIRICLMENISRIGDRKSWQAPFGILFTVGTVFPTVEFKDLGFSKDTWQAIFIIVGIISFIWLIYTLIRMPSKVTVDKIIDELIPPGTEIKK